MGHFPVAEMMKEGFAALVRGSLFMLVVAVAVFGLFRASHCSAHQTAQAVIRERGEPTTLEELDLWYPAVPPAENAALLYERAFSLLVTNAHLEVAVNFVQGHRWGIFSERLPLPWECQPAVTDNCEVFETLAAARKLTRCRYTIDLGKRDDPNMVQLGVKLQQTWSLLILRVAFAIRAGRSDDALDSVLSMAGLTQSLKELPCSVATQARLTGLGFSLHAVESLLRQRMLSDDQYQEMASALAGLEDHSMLRRQLLADRCQMISAFQGGFATQDPVLKGRINLLRWTGAWDNSALWLLRICSENAALSALPYAERLEQAEKLEAKVARQLRYPRNPYESDARARLAPEALVTLCKPEIYRFHVSAVELQKRLEVVLIALAIERYRRANAGSLPVALDALTPRYLLSAPQDPLGGKAYLFRTDGTNYTVEDAKLDGGGWQMRAKFESNPKPFIGH